MHNNPIQTNLLRKSFEFQSNSLQTFIDSPSDRINNINVQKNSRIYRQETYNNTIKNMQNRLQNFQSLLRNKDISHLTQFSRPFQQNQQISCHGNFQKQYSETLLRGSCQENFQSFDYQKYKTQSKQDSLVENVNKNQLRRSPGRQNPFTNHSNKVKKMKSDQFQKKLIEKEQVKASEFGSRMSPSKNLIKFFNQRQNSRKLSQKEIDKMPQIGSENEQKVDKITKIKDELKQIKTSLNIFSKSQLQTQDQSPKTPSYIGFLKPFKEVFEESLEKSETKPKLSTILNSFQLGPIIGKGKFGQVYLARHHDLGFLVAIKKIQKQKIVQYKMIDQFIKEIRLHSCLDHPNIVKFYGLFQHDDSIYLVMEYLNGGTLFQYLDQVQSLSAKETAQFLKDIIQALCYMHNKSIAHRDIKPENIVISSEKVAKLCDFGWSSLVQTSRKTYCGTLDYAPPEILEHKSYDLSVDIWCIGVLAYELMTGKIPFEAEQRKIIRDKIINVDKAKIQFPHDIVQEARVFIQALIQKDPSKRPKSHELLNFQFFNVYLQKQKGINTIRRKMS